MRLRQLNLVQEIEELKTPPSKQTGKTAQRQERTVEHPYQQAMAHLFPL